MKKTFPIACALLLLVASCHSKSKPAEVKTNVEVGIPNNNGGIPDTTNAEDLHMDKKAAASRDSAK